MCWSRAHRSCPRRLNSCSPPSAGSGSLLSEAVHSVADCSNQVRSFTMPTVKHGEENFCRLNCEWCVRKGDDHTVST